MTACIVGWSHGKFGKLDGETSESLIVKAASEAIAHAGIEPKDVDVIYVGNMNGGFVRQEFHSSLPLQTHPDLRFKPVDPRRERLRHRLGRDPHGAEHARRQEGALRPGGRRREDDRAQFGAGRRGADQGVVRRRGSQYRGGLRRHLRQDHLGLLPALRRQVRRARQDRGQGAQERRQEPVRAFPEGIRLRVLPHAVGQEPVRRRPAEAHRLLAGDRRRRRRRAGRRRHGARHEAGDRLPRRRSTSTTSCR